MVIRLGSGLVLPVQSATETFLIVGKRGSGKSSTATRLAEQFVHAKVPIAVLDPVDVWWGLKAGADGQKDGGLEVYVFGGEHADNGLALEPTAGTLMADTLVDHRINAVFVLRAFSNREKARFVSDFAEQLFKRNRDVLHLFCEEAHELMPQNPYAGEEEMLGRMLRLEKLGRTSGIGMTAITQRPASLNKNATTQAEVLVAHRILGAQDVKAIDGWIEHHHQQEQRKEVLSSIATLKTGEAWFWAPDFPEDNPVGLRRVQVLMPDTFDSRKTPKPGERRVEPKSLAPVDLDRLGEKMKATRERAVANDPKTLRAHLAERDKRIAILEKNYREFAATVRSPAKSVEAPVLKDVQVTKLVGLAERLDKTASALLVQASEIIASVRSAAPAKTVVGLPAVAPVRAAAPRPNLHRPRTSAHGPASAEARGVRSGEPRTPSDLTEPQQRILDVIAELNRRGIEPERVSVARWQAIHPNGGSYGENLGYLRREGYLDGWRLNGRAAPRPYVPEGVSGAMAALPDAPKKNALEAIVEWHETEGTVATREQIAEKLGLHPNGGSYGENLGWLRAMKIVTKTGLVPTEALFR